MAHIKVTKTRKSKYRNQRLLKQGIEEDVIPVEGICNV